MQRALDIGCLLLFGVLAIYNIVVAELAAVDERYCEATFYLVHGLIFLALFAGARWSFSHRADLRDE